MSSEYEANELASTVDWLTKVQNEDGGWGLYPAGESHLPITGEVVHALSQVTFPNARVATRRSRKYLRKALDQTVHTRQSKTAVHLAWTVIGATVARVGMTDGSLQAAVHLLSEIRVATGWRWEFSFARDAGIESESYPTHVSALALQVFRAATKSSLPVPSSVSASVIARVRARLQEANTTADALALAYDVRTASDLGVDIDSMTWQSFASIIRDRAAADIAVLNETYKGPGVEEVRVPWHHCVTQQLLLAMLNAPDRRIVASAVSLLLPRLFALRLSPGRWLDPLRDCETPYSAADALLALARLRDYVASFENTLTLLLATANAPVPIHMPDSHDRTTPYKAFISYSAEDEKVATRIRHALKPLEREGLLVVWSFRKLSAGDKVDPEIHAKLEDSDIFLPLISVSYLASEYVTTQELPTMLQRQQNRRARIIPILAGTVDWRSNPLRDLWTLPAGKRALKEAGRASDRLLAEVITGIREVVGGGAGRSPK